MMNKYPYKNLFLYDNTKQDLLIESEDNTVKITNSEIHYESFNLCESIFSGEQLVFGTVEASMVKFTVSNVIEPLKNKKITVSSFLNGKSQPFVYGKYKVYSDSLSSDRKKRDIVAYDKLQEIIETNVAVWYNTILPEKDSTITLKEFRNLFASYFGLEEEETTLCNDNMVIKKTVEPSEISGKDVLSAYCEINGCFPNISREGKLQYITLKGTSPTIYPNKDLYPSDNLYPAEGSPYKIYNGNYKVPKTIYPSNDLFPSYDLKPISAIENDVAALFSKKFEYEDFKTKAINKLQLRKEENDIGTVVGEGKNVYIVQDNFLLYGKGNKELKEVAQNMFSVIKDISYVPYTCQIKANPSLELGDAINVYTKEGIVKSYVLNREIKGIQLPIDELKAKGTDEISENLNTNQRSIIELKGKANILTRTVDETRSYIYDTEEKLSSVILQQAGQIALRVRKDQIISEINLTPEQITISANKIDLIGIVNSDTFIANLINAEQLNTKFATAENLNAVNAKFNNLNANNLKVGTVSTARLDVDGLLGEFASKTIQAISFTAQTIRGSTYEYFDGEYQQYIKLDLMTVNIGGENYRVLGYKV